MLQSHLIDELIELSAQLTNPTLEQLALMFGIEDYYSDKQEGITLYSKWTNKPVKCRLCDCSDKWIEEGTVFVCDHTREYDLGLPLRVVDSIKISEVYIKD